MGFVPENRARLRELRRLADPEAVAGKVHRAVRRRGLIYKLRCRDISATLKEIAGSVAMPMTMRRDSRLGLVRIFGRRDYRCWLVR